MRESAEHEHGHGPQHVGPQARLRALRAQRPQVVRGEYPTRTCVVLCCVVLSTVQYKTQYSDPAARHVGARRVLTVRQNNATRGVATMSS